MSADLNCIVADSAGRVAAVITSHVTRNDETVYEDHVLLFTLADAKITEIRTPVPNVAEFTRFWT